MAEDLKERVRQLIEQPLADNGFEIAELVLSQFKSQSTLRVFVYSEKPATIADIGGASRLVGDMIEGTDLFEKGYTLELSSPGLDRPLTTGKDFKYRKGEKVRIEFEDKARKKETAEITSVDNDKVSFRNDSGEFTLDVAEIKRAKILY